MILTIKMTTNASLFVIHWFLYFVVFFLLLTASPFFLFSFVGVSS